jgi:hypothetical protein
MTVFLLVAIGKSLATDAPTIRLPRSGCAEVRHSEQANEHAVSV